ncbi:MAG: carbohydrate ABC transporter permease [Planctomycetota bacterium]
MKPHPPTTRARTGLPRLIPHLVLVPLALLMLTPFVWLAVASLKLPEDFVRSLWIPRNAEGVLEWSSLTLENFRFILFGPAESLPTEGSLSLRREPVGMARALFNSIFLASTTALLATLCCAAAGYALAVFKFRGRKAITWLVLGALIIPPPLILAPGYEWLFRLGLLDSYLGLILPAAAPAFGVFLFRQAALSSIPAQLMEAARLDGAGELRTFLTIGLPLLRPMIGAFLMITYLATWNNFIQPQIVLQSSERFPLSVAIAQLRDLYYQDYGLLMAGTVLSVAPVLILFLVLQREFINGLTLGAVKG